MASKPKTERLGIAKLDELFSNAGWLFREQPIHDVGIDAQVEVVTDNQPTGRLIAMQVKSGASYFAERTRHSIVFRPSAKHARYWIKHSLPVIVVLFEPTSKKLYWAPATSETLQESKSRFRLDIPLSSILEASSLPALESLDKSTLQERKIYRLLLDLEWIRRVDEGERVVLRFYEWVNKSLSRTSLELVAEDSHPPMSLHIPTIYCPGVDSLEIASNYLPWAEFEMDTEAYRDHMEEVYEDECFMAYDREDGKTYYTEELDDWYEEPEGIQPVGSDGEVDNYQVVLSLNEVGRSFLTLSEYLFDVNRYDLFHFGLGRSGGS
jgi:hypothetical protein